MNSEGDFRWSRRRAASPARSTSPCADCRAGVVMFILYIPDFGFYVKFPALQTEQLFIWPLAPWNDILFGSAHQAGCASVEISMRTQGNLPRRSRLALLSPHVGRSCSQAQRRRAGAADHLASVYTAAAMAVPG